MPLVRVFGDVEYPTEMNGMMIIPSTWSANSPEGIDTLKTMVNVTNTQIDLLNFKLGDSENQLNNIGTSQRIVYVSKNFVNPAAHAPQGSFTNPFTNLSDAVDSITDNTVDCRYLIRLGPGNYQEKSLVLKSYVSICGFSPSVTHIELETPIAVDNAIPGRTNISNIRFVDTFGAKLKSNGVVVEFTNCQLLGPFVWNASSANDVIECWNTQFMGNIELHGGSGLLKNCYAPVKVLMDTVGISDEATFTIDGTTVESLIISSRKPIYVTHLGTILDTLEVYNPTSTLLTHSIPLSFKTINNPVISLTNSSNGVQYKPENESDWNGDVPTTVQHAIDIIASKLNTSSKIPVAIKK